MNHPVSTLPCSTFFKGFVALTFAILLSACGGDDNDSTPPVITLSGENTISLEFEEEYIEQGATATDDEDGAIEVVISGHVNITYFGEYTVTYTATDSSGNTSSISRMVSINQRPFITTWNTRNQGYSGNDQVLLTTKGTGYNYQVDWGDGVIDSNITGNITHTYEFPGTKTISIKGDFPQVYFEGSFVSNDKQKLTSIEQWGDIKWLSMKDAFKDCTKLTGNATDAPDLSMIADISGMFHGARRFSQDLEHWDVSNVTDMSNLFRSSAFNGSVNNWDTANVTNMKNIFFGAFNFNQSLNNWDISSLTDMSYMFYQASKFNQPLDNWNVSSVTDMSYMFYGAESFNQNINNWDVSLVTDMNHMFSAVVEPYNTETTPVTFNQPLNNWDVSSVTDMSSMFYYATEFNQNLSNWDVSAVTNMSSWFEYATSFNQKVSNGDTSSVTDMSRMFYRATSFNQDINNWDTSSVTNMYTMFTYAEAFNKELNNWDVGSVIDMRSMFESADNFNQSLNNWDVSSVTNMQNMFFFASSFNQSLDNWDVSNVTHMGGMFHNERYTTQEFDQNLGSWDVSSVTHMYGIFEYAKLSTENYDALLQGWSAQSLQSGVYLSGGDSTYSSESQAARDALINTYNWRVFDGGLAR